MDRDNRFGYKEGIKIAFIERAKYVTKSIMGVDLFAIKCTFAPHK